MANIFAHLKRIREWSTGSRILKQPFRIKQRVCTLSQKPKGGGRSPINVIGLLLLSDG